MTECVRERTCRSVELNSNLNLRLTKAREKKGIKGESMGLQLTNGGGTANFGKKKKKTLQVLKPEQGQ